MTTGFIQTYLWLLGPFLVRYLIIASVTHGYFWNRRVTAPLGFRLATQKPQGAHIWREARTSLLASFIYAFPAAIMVHAYKLGGTKLSLSVPETVWDWLWIPISIGIYLFLHDAYFYWTHRGMHHPKVYRAMHHAHHTSKQPSAYASFAFHPWEAIVAAWFVPALTFV
ncbi:MAG: sterol desaturase family protein, partial [Pseudomonadota bacterium]